MARRPRRGLASYRKPPTQEVAPVPSAPAEEFLELPGGRVHLFRSAGQDRGTGEPLLFLYAAGGSACGLTSTTASRRPASPSSRASRLRQVRRLPRANGHRRPRVPLPRRARRALGLDRPHVVGASFGGWIAAELAVHSPHRIGSLTLLSAAGLRLPEARVPDIFLMPPALLVT